jgi:adenine-specific DNA methylase
MKRPRVLIEEWLPAAAIGVECMRERGSASALAPTTYLHVWWARRPLTVSRAAVLGSLLPADFPREVFEKLLGFGQPAADLVRIRQLMDTGYRVPGGFNCDRAFKRALRDEHLQQAHAAVQRIWEMEPVVIDPMAGGGSIPLESARLGFRTIASEYNPVACTVLEATVAYPLRHGERLAVLTRKWAKVWGQRILKRLGPFYPEHRFAKVHAYIFARTVPCPNTQHHTPLVPDWHLLRPKTGTRVVAVPRAHRDGTWSVQMREVGRRAGQLREAPPPTYSDGKGISLFTNLQIPADYIKAKAQAGEMKSTLYAVALKTPQGLQFRPPTDADLEALKQAAAEMKRVRAGWEKSNTIPTEAIPGGDQPGKRLEIGGITRWRDLFSARQLLCFGVLVEELRKLRPEIVAAEGKDLGEAVIHLLAFVLDKFGNHNAILASWDPTTNGIRSVFDRHGYSFKPAWAEMAPCNSGSGLDWAIDNVLTAYEEIAKLCKDSQPESVEITLGSATNLAHLADGSVTAVVVDPPYADNVQYSELADFFYVWLKRTQGHRRPEWFSTYLCEHDEEAVVNVSRHRDNGRLPAGEARAAAHAFYQKLMTETFTECRRILRDDGVLTVMFTHKKQQAWERLFTSLIRSGFLITATWPVKTESEHSLHQARKNAAQSTVLLVARKRPAGSGAGYFNAEMQAEIRERARAAADRLQREGLNPVDQLVGSFGPAIEVYSRYDEVRLDTGEPVGVDRAIDEASDAVSQWRIEQLAARGLADVEPEGRFALLCWDVLGAAEFRFNEAKLLGHAVGMDVDTLVGAGLVTKSGDKIQMLSVKDRRRKQPLEPAEVIETMFGPVTKSGKRKRKGDVLMVHPNDPQFRTALDACHALALRYLEAGGGKSGIGSTKALVRQQGWKNESSVARLMAALVEAAPPALRKEGVKNRFPEFRAWHELLEPLFEIAPPDWTEPAAPQFGLAFPAQEGELLSDEEGEEEEEE